MNSPNLPTSTIQWFREASPYINAHRGRTLVLCLPDTKRLDDGPVTASSGEIAVGKPQRRAGRLDTLTHDITLLSHLGVRIVLCVGLRAQVDARLQLSSEPSNVIDGRRVTDAAALDAIRHESGLVRADFEGRFSTGLPNTPMAGAHMLLTSGNFVTAQPFGVHDGVDYQHTGAVRQVHADAINTALDAGHVVLLPPLGYSRTGDVFNLPAEEVAMETAVALQADKLVMLVQQLPVDPDGHSVREASAANVEKLAVSQPSEDLNRTLARSVDASRRGVDRVHLLDENDPDALLTELFTRDGSGAMITQQHWESIRQATIEDVGGIISLISPLQENGTLAARSREQLELDIDCFYVSEREGMIVACAALFVDHPLSGAQSDDQATVRSGEVGCLATHPDYRGAGRAERLLLHLEARARDAGCGRIVLLSTRTGHWFLERGFEQSSPDQLPEARRNNYNRLRNSRVYEKRLG